MLPPTNHRTTRNNYCRPYQDAVKEEICDHLVMSPQNYLRAFYFPTFWTKEIIAIEEGLASLEVR